MNTTETRTHRCEDAPETRTYRVLYQYEDGTHSFHVLMDGHDMADAMAYPFEGARAIFATEIPGSRRPLGLGR